MVADRATTGEAHIGQGHRHGHAPTSLSLLVARMLMFVQLVLLALVGGVLVVAGFDALNFAQVVLGFATIAVLLWFTGRDVPGRIGVALAAEAAIAFLLILGALLGAAITLAGVAVVISCFAEVAILAWALQRSI